MNDDTATAAFSQVSANPKEIQFSDLFDIASIQELQDQFASAAGVASLITTPNGDPITKPSNFCRLCDEIIHKTEKGLCNCHRSDTAISRSSPSGPIIHLCLSSGLWDAGASITVGGKHVASWLIGQVRDVAQDPAQMLDYAGEIGADRGAYRTALAEVPVMSKASFEKTAQLLFSFANALSTQAYQNIQQARLIAEGKAAAARIERLTQLYAALSECNQAIVRCKSKEELLPQICRAVVRVGGMKMAWVGLSDEATLIVRPAASYGVGTEYLEGLKISVDENEPIGRGPAGTSIRENRPVWCQDFQNDPITAPWHESGSRCCWGGAASFPLVLGGKAIGALIVYSESVGTFDEEVRKLLVEMASDIGFAFESFAREKERREAVEALRANEERLRSLINAMPDFVCFKDAQGRWLEANDAALEIFNLREIPYRGKTNTELADYQVTYRSVFLACENSNEATWNAGVMRRDEEIIPGIDGTERVHEVTKVPLFTPDGERKGLVVLGRDITERKQAENALRQSEERFRSVFQQIPSVSIQAYGPDGTTRYWNQASELLYGYTAEEAIGRNLLDLIIPPETRDVVAQAIRWMAETGQPIPPGELSLMRKDGSRISVFSSHALVKVPGCPAELFCVDVDLTDRKQAEQKITLAKSQMERGLKFKKALLSAIPTPVFYKDKECRYLGCNAAFTEIMGFTAEELLGKTVQELWPGDGANIYQNADRELIEQPEHQIYESHVRDKNGATRDVIFAKDVFLDENEQVAGIIGAFIDITERKQMEQRLLQTQRLESIGTLAAGIAHDLNNILAPIMMSTDMLRAPESAEFHSALLDTVEQCAQRGAAVVNQVLTFARGGVEGERTTLQLNGLVQEMEKVMRETFPKNITLTISIPSDLRSVKGDRTQIHQVLLNLCINARDAMPGGGLLQISARNTTIDNTSTAMPPDAKAGNYASLKITDSGTGIPQGIIDRIFDPFYTTKEVGKGTGLGLSTVLGIVRSHGGFLTVESTEGRGTTFEVFLPSEKTGTETPDGMPHTEAQHGRGETILLVDDEASVSKLTSLVLKKNGYRVLSACDGTSALTLYRHHMSEIAVVLTDMMMPGMDGVKLARALKEVNPGVKIVVSTGQAEETCQKDLRSLGIHVLLHKPYSSPELLSTLHDLIHVK